MRLMHCMSKDMKSGAIVGNYCSSEKFGVDVYQGFVLTPLLLILM